jgi:phospholipase/carboxylesterase
MTADLAWLPTGRAEQLMILLHGVGADAQNLAPLAATLRQRFPQAAVLAPQGFEAFDMAPVGRQWFSVRGVTEQNRVERVAAVLPRLLDWVRAAQQRTGVGPAATALVGFSQGSILSLEAVAAEDGIAGRVLAFSGRYARLPAQAPALSTIHILHGTADAVMPVAQARQAFEHLAQLNGDATIDLAEGVGHELHPALIDCALHRLTSHIPMRTWQAALGGLPAGHDPH